VIIQIIAIIAILAALWYIDTYILIGTDKQLIFVKIVSLILALSVLSVILLKVISPKELDNSSLDMIFGLIKDITLIIVGYLFAKKETTAK